MRPLLFKLLQKTGHGELLILYALVLALGGAELFELGGIKDDLGALIMGILISTHPKSKEMAKAMLGFKDLFLVGFFLSIGVSGELSLELFIIGLLLVPLIFIKSTFFYLLMTGFRLRARTSLLATINLTNYSEFGLIVTAIGVSNNWISAQWLVVMAIAVSASFIIAAILGDSEKEIYNHSKNFWLKFQSKKRLADDQAINMRDETIAIFGMGRVGCGTYDKMHDLHGDIVVGIDSDTSLVKQLQKTNRKVILGDPSDADFWHKVDKKHSIKLVMLALPRLSANIDAIEQLRDIAFTGKIAATARYPDEVDRLLKAGATEVFDLYSSAGSGFAKHIEDKIRLEQS